MDRRNFLKNAAVIAASATMPEIASATQKTDNLKNIDRTGMPLIASAPFLQNYAETSIGIAFAVNDLANGYVTWSTKPDMSDATTVKCGGYRVTDMNDKVMLVRLNGLKPATKYYYRIGADRIKYVHGHKMSIIGNEEDHKIYSFTTAGKQAKSHFCVINDTHNKWIPFGNAVRKIAELSPSCVIWNGDTSDQATTIDDQKKTFLTPPVDTIGYASEIPYLLCPGNHDSRGLANRRLERIWMFRQPEERSSRDWDLGRNFAVRMGDIALIGLDTAEDKVDENPLFAGLFNSKAYREAQTLWLKDVLRRKEIKSAPFIVAFCHIPLFDTNPKANPGNIHPNDTDPRYSEDFAMWQKDCGEMWLPMLEKVGCQLIVCGHTHKYRFDAPDNNHKWAQMVGGGPSAGGEGRFNSLIEGKVVNNKLQIIVYNIDNGSVYDRKEFDAR